MSAPKNVCRHLSTKVYVDIYEINKFVIILIYKGKEPTQTTHKSQAPNVHKNEHINTLKSFWFQSNKNELLLNLYNRCRICKRNFIQRPFGKSAYL